MDDRMREVYNYLSDNNYPPSYSMLQKLTLRRYASNLPFKFAEQYLTSGSIDQVETSPASIRAERLEIAGLLMENQGNIDEYCIICSMMDLQSANTTINMVQRASSDPMTDPASSSTPRNSRADVSELPPPGGQALQVSALSSLVAWPAGFVRRDEEKQSQSYTRPLWF
ncbi:UNVERIFIED_CONTAM: hypothetical protein FKN15_055320 [Acipenser sinensis]